MTDTTDVAVEPNIADGSEPPAGGPATVTVEPAARRTPMPKIGVWSWAFVGFTIAAVIVVIVLGAVSEIALPMLFAAVLAIIFKPLVGVLQRHKLKPTLAAGADRARTALVDGRRHRRHRPRRDRPSRPDRRGHRRGAWPTPPNSSTSPGSTQQHWTTPGRPPKGRRR